jgi:hypothetical protein
MDFIPSKYLAILFLGACIGWASTFVYRVTQSRVRLPFAGTRYGNEAARRYRYQHDALSVLEEGEEEVMFS